MLGVFGNIHHIKKLTDQPVPHIWLQEVASYIDALFKNKALQDVSDFVAYLQCSANRSARTTISKQVCAHVLSVAHSSNPELSSREWVLHLIEQRAPLHVLIHDDKYPSLRRQAEAVIHLCFGQYLDEETGVKATFKKLYIREKRIAFDLLIARYVLSCINASNQVDSDQDKLVEYACHSHALTMLGEINCHTELDNKIKDAHKQYRGAQTQFLSCELLQ